MNKIMFFVAILFVLGAVSCKKDHTCSCTTSDSSGAISETTTSFTINETKSKAEDACTAANFTVGTLSTSCALD